MTEGRGLAVDFPLTQTLSVFIRGLEPPCLIILAPPLIPVPFTPQGTVLDYGQTLATDKSAFPFTGKTEWKPYFPPCQQTEVHASLLGEKEQFWIVFKLHPSILFLSPWHMNPVTFLSCIAWVNSSFGRSSSTMFNYLMPVGLKIKMTGAGSRFLEVVCLWEVGLHDTSLKLGRGGTVVFFSFLCHNRLYFQAASCLRVASHTLTMWHRHSCRRSSLPLHFDSHWDSAPRSPGESASPRGPRGVRFFPKYPDYLSCSTGKQQQQNLDFKSC